MHVPLFVLATLVTAALAARWEPPRLGPTAWLDRRVADYIEDEDSGRRLAEVRAGLALREGRRQLELELSAVGARVDPLPGSAGVPGANLRTALELADLLDSGALEVVSFDDHADDAGRAHGPGGRGRVTAGRRGRLPTRRLTDDGRLLHGATDPLLISLRVVSAPLGTGRQRLELRVAGVPRLVVTAELDDVGGRITSIASLAAHPPVDDAHSPEVVP